MRVALIDGDIWAYRYSWANQQTIDWGDTGVSECADIDGAKADVKRAVEKLFDLLTLDRMVVALSSFSNFRKTLNPLYKADRKTKKCHRPMLLKELRLWLIEQYDCRIIKDMEADDVLGILQTGNTVEGKKIIVSTDKDLLTVPGWNYNPNTEVRKNIQPQQAAYFFYQQVLTGDPTDNYKGVPGIGPAKAQRILAQSEDGEPRQWWPLIVKAYEAAGLTIEDAIMNARMAYILRAENYDFQKEEIKLWEPPQ